MHVPDGFLDLPTSIATGAIAAAGLAVALPLARRENADGRKAPMIGIVTTVIFAAQMINFPVSAGTSGHLLGGALAAVLLGPGTGFICLSVILIVQAFVFGDGGVTALGTNITLMGAVAIMVGWVAFRGGVAVLPRRRSSVVVASALGAFVSVPAAAAAFALLFAVGGSASVSVELVFSGMVGWHTLIGIGEAVITAVVVGAISAVRPDLVNVLGPRTAEARTAKATASA